MTTTTHDAAHAEALAENAARTHTRVQLRIGTTRDGDPIAQTAARAEIARRGRAAETALRDAANQGNPAALRRLRRVTKINAIVAAVVAGGMAFHTEDLMDIVDQVDDGVDPYDWTGSPESAAVHTAVQAAVAACDESAYDLAQSARKVLGW